MVCIPEVTFSSWFDTASSLKAFELVYLNSFQMNQQHTFLEVKFLCPSDERYVGVRQFPLSLSMGETKKHECRTSLFSPLFSLSS